MVTQQLCGRAFDLWLNVLSDNNLRQVVYTHSPSRSQWPSSGTSGATWENPGSNHAAGSGIHCNSHCNMQSWTRAAAPSCSAWVDSAFYSMVKWVSAFGLSNNKMDSDGGCLWKQPNGRLTAQLGWLGLSVGSHLALSAHLPDEPMNQVTPCNGICYVMVH